VQMGRLRWESGIEATGSRKGSVGSGDCPAESFEKAILSVGLIFTPRTDNLGAVARYCAALESEVKTNCLLLAFRPRSPLIAPT